MQSLPAHISQTPRTNWLGPRGHVLQYSIRRGELMNFVGFIERDDWQIEFWTVQGTTNELVNDFRGWHPDVHTVIRNIDIPFKWALMIRGPWSAGPRSGLPCSETPVIRRFRFLVKAASWLSRTATSLPRV